MTPQSITLQHIYDLLLDSSERLASVETEVRGVRAGYIEHGKALGEIDDKVLHLEHVCVQRGQQCGARFKRISREVHGVGEVTGVVQLDHIKRDHMYKTLTKVGAGVLAVATVLAAFWGALGTSCRSEAVTVPVPVVVPVEKHSKQLGRVEHNQDVLMSEMGKLGWFNIGVVSVPTLGKSKWQARR